MNPATFLRVLGPEPWSVAYDEPSIRPDDSRYGDNPNRLQRHTQFQVIVKPAPKCPQELVVGSYEALGIDTSKHDIRFVEDNWESPALGAWGLGWEVWLDGMEVTQFTYFQQAGSMPLESVSVEITYGLERIIMLLQGKKHFRDIVFAPGITYGEIFMQNEVEMSRYNLDEADVSRNNQMFELYEKEALFLLSKRLPVPAYNYLLKASQTFNILDARGAIGVTERARYFQRMRLLSRDVARLWVERREEEGFPLILKTTSQDTKEMQTSLPVHMPSPSSDTADFVFEIGLEELPASDVPSTISQVKTLLSEILSAEKLSHSALEVNGTPRRVCALVKGLKTRQEDESMRIRGPPLRIALKDGKMTKAAQGFKRSQGVDDSCIEVCEDDGYMYANVEYTGKTAFEVLSDAIPSALLSKINFVRSMRWNDSGVSFSRPIRWMVCLLGDQVVPFAFAGVQSERTTRSLRQRNGFANDVEIRSASEYQSVLSRLDIVPSGEERAIRIRMGATSLASDVGGHIPPEYLSGPLFDEITNLVENPIPILGRYDEAFLRLPEEVLVTVMKKHQRYFPVVSNATGDLLNAFVTVANGESDNIDRCAVRQGNEAVLQARYSDATFFYTKDSDGKTLGDFVPHLKSITFQESMGSMLEKVRRVEATTRDLCNLMSLDEYESETAALAAKLYKADLATSMVVEMTALAGIMGRHYSEKSGEVPVAVSQAIFEANLPRFSGDELASSLPGAAVSVADRIDSLVALFSVGLLPKSTSDPFALRRAALGAVQTLIQCGRSVDLREIVSISAEAISSQTGQEVEADTVHAVVEFITRRLESHLLDGLEYQDDVVKSVLAVPKNAVNPVSAERLCKTVSRLLSTSTERQLVIEAQEVHGRAARLLKGVKGLSLEELRYHAVDDRLFEHDEERRLLEAILHDKSDIGLVNRLQRLVLMKQTVHNFFENVFVNADDEATRMNRLALCARVVAVSEEFLDLNQLVL
ncbi:unnamed protein product [Chondrus crispus]|uniref:glycine--tRNA ligase n=1 Tax=Chondrus crispus TaxID=2769 RepID=R7QG42_CHOCR|nr:unnamed protein product [Chondrus crispus]CDF36748.1 unnamed protein product [Chondrus crispus]|eukprot:XP_005716567.1 unnamed protein product [Chondrus crispus]